MNRFFLALSFCFFSGWLVVNAQTTVKKPLSVGDFAAWEVLNNPAVSNDGKWVAFEQNPLKGDGMLVVKSIDSKKVDSLARGFDARFSPESDFIAYKIRQPEDSVRSAKKRKVKKELMPKDSLGILVFKKHKVYTFANLKQFALPKENARWVAFLTDMKKPKRRKKKKQRRNQKVRNR